LKFYFVFILSLFYFISNGQDDLLELLESQQEPVTTYTIATFKNTRLVTGHSVETNGQGVLQFLVGHRFGRLSSGWRNLYGLDNATIRMGFEYGITDNINFARQKYGDQNFPFTATMVSGIYVNGLEWSHPDRKNYFSSRLTYHHSLLIARKFGHGFSLQLMPTVTHRNLVLTEMDRNTVLGLGLGTSVKVTGSMRVNAEYYYILPDQIVSTIGGEPIRNTFSIGIDLETGGHVFQLHFTNSRGMTEKFLVGETTGSFGNGDIHFGFNVSRVFTLKKPKDFEE